ncbi:MAG: sulfatase-like hydrolase/transferase [Sedimentisphaerales bacterium]|nr:sulfatase-like hydrolase/transferase [Sedimentisphaerales bacterium]
MNSSVKTISRRTFLRTSAGAAAAVVLAPTCFAAKKKVERPNILWLSCEDISPDLGCYGDKYSVSPNIDALAARGTRYDNVYSHSGVCAPTRSGIITGMYPTTIGTHHMRCNGVPPAYVRCFPEYLRAAGYYCTNNSKTDYQFASPPSAWDQNGKNAHWQNRPEGKPFFAVFNFTVSHESQIRNRSKGMLDRVAKLGDKKHDPAKAPLPPYYPDTEIVRKDVAQYYDVITLMDRQVGSALKELEDAGLAEDTIVWFWGDHGRGLPRGKRWIYDSGIRVPLIIHVPEKWRKLAMPADPDAVGPGSINDDLVAFIDFAPTMLSLAGLKIPSHIQGQAFLGHDKAPPRQYIYAARDRMDETYDLIRAVRDKRYKYIRNYMWYVTRGQEIEYMDQMPAMQEMRRLNAEGKLKGPRLQYFEPTKPVEELYDCRQDPHEVENLAGKRKYEKILQRMRAAHEKWAEDTGDIGLMPEGEFDEIKRPGGKFQKTAPPVFRAADWSAADADGKPLRIAIASPTPGASVVYRIERPAKKNPWMLYTKSVWLEPGWSVRAKACRIGFNDSDEVTFKPGDKSASKLPASTTEDPDHWRNKIPREMLERLRKIKSLDGQGKKAIPQYSEALKDKYPAVRYWAVVGLHTSCESAESKESAARALKPMLEDDAAIVRIAAAQALCEWNGCDNALPVLADALDDSNPKVRLCDLAAIKAIGSKARPLLSRLDTLLKDADDDDIKKFARSTIKHLKTD